MALSDRWKLRLLAVAVVLFTSPAVVRILQTGQLRLNVFRYEPVGDVLNVAGFVAGTLYLAWSVLLARLEQY